MKEAIKIIKQELKWCEEHKGYSGQGEEYERAFKNGIIAIHNLLSRADINTKIIIPALIDEGYLDE